MNISTRIQRCWAELSGAVIHSQGPEELIPALKAWIASSLVRLSARAKASAEASMAMDFVLRCAPSESPITHAAFEALRNTVSKAIETKDEGEFFRYVDGLIFNVLHYPIDECTNCRDDERYILYWPTQQAFVKKCAFCGLVYELESERRVSPDLLEYPTKSQIFAALGISALAANHSLQARRP